MKSLIKMRKLNNWPKCFYPVGKKKALSLKILSEVKSNIAFRNTFGFFLHQEIKFLAFMNSAKMPCRLVNIKRDFYWDVYTIFKTDLIYNMGKMRISGTEKNKILNKNKKTAIIPIFWYQKFDFLYQEMVYFLISKNHFLISRMHFLHIRN